MAKNTVLLLGATGETGGEILNGLVEDGNYEVACLVRPSSANSPAVQELSTRGHKIVVTDLQGSFENLVEAVKGYDTIISAISAPDQTKQLELVDAAAAAGTKRFVPCAFMTVCPPGGVIGSRDDKEIVYQRIWYHHLPYTIIDVGYWHQASVPRLASGKIDSKLLVARNEIYEDGNGKSMLSDKRDIGRWVARIVKDERTINAKVFTHSDFLSQNEIVQIVEEKSGEKLELTHLPTKELKARREKAWAAYAADPTNISKRLLRSIDDYNVSKYIRQDDTPENAKYLGYLDARQLYPDVKTISFAEFVDHLLADQTKRPYEGKHIGLMKPTQ